jgi:nucleoside-diphosphate-sugar epimerase
MKVLVTGSAGFIAQALMRLLTDAGFRVSGLDKDPSATSHYVCSILDAATLKKIVGNIEPDALIHLAARTDLDERTDLAGGYAANIDGVRNLIEVVRATPSIKRAIWTSSQLVQGGYYVHVGREPLWKSYSYIENVAFQYMRLLQAPAELMQRETFYLADYEPIDLQAWCDAFQRALDVPPIRHVPIDLARALARCGDAVNALGIRGFPFNSFRLNNVLTQYRFDTTATEAVCGRLPYTMEQGVAETAAWLRRMTAKAAS